ncbi:molybdenum cofactor cytidylyltransferase [Halobiforma lacisalsi AJ5]|uniref:Molybdenum cofactor cytidylyltransferase n=1 Tax=Natronobacterium lacisalsi AJ5 TaxID=358396 RepID=M0LM76_NATLA|nr:nucleotidyltransferase family protein [Halobiforma lacisalsi]APW96898.1 molybdenum cofactor cytidylyltransferase [Halobiforma lacisalsi AJ5]EMA34606.1 molybdenum cofactor cytidylyltransferase / molybdopterin molybdochelatase [Halobiforma lacisalsi AJ5]
MTVIGVVLAAGRGTRFADGNKLLATVGTDGEPIVSRAARTFDVAAVDRVIAVLGHDADTIEGAVADRVDATVHNPDHERGQSTSVRAGARAAREHGAEAAVFLPGDMPLIDPGTVTRLVDEYRSTDAPVVVPVFDGRRGNPVLFDSSLFDALTEISGDTGGRALFDSVDVRRVAVTDPGIHRDVDTVADLERMRQSDGGDGSDGSDGDRS